MSAAANVKRKCSNPTCCTYNLEVTTAIQTCIGCRRHLPRVHAYSFNASDLGDVFGSFFGGAPSETVG